MNESSLSALKLRQKFDESFANHSKKSDGSYEKLILVRVAARRFALMLKEISQIQQIGKILRLPGSNPGVVGLAGLRGQLVPVFSLAHFFDLRSGDPGPNWLAILTPIEFTDPIEIALRFDQPLGYVEVSMDHLYQANLPDAKSQFIYKMFHVGSEIVEIISLPAILREIHRKTYEGKSE